MNAEELAYSEYKRSRAWPQCSPMVVRMDISHAFGAGFEAGLAHAYQEASEYFARKAQALKEGKE